MSYELFTEVGVTITDDVIVSAMSDGCGICLGTIAMAALDAWTPDEIRALADESTPSEIRAVETFLAAMRGEPST